MKKGDHYVLSCGHEGTHVRVKSVGDWTPNIYTIEDDPQQEP